MGNFLKTQNVFSSGEVAPEFYAINTVHGVAKLENMDVLESGALKRRPGLKKIKNIANNSILVPFVINDAEKYLLVFYDRLLDVYYNDNKIATVVTPWYSADLNKLQYVQRFNTMFFVHPNYAPQILTKNANGFSLSVFRFYMNSNTTLNIPFMRYDDTQDISITIGTSNIDNNHATFTASADLWDNTWLNVRLLVNNKQWIVESVQSARIATVYTNGDFTIPITPITDWFEAAFNTRRGWPMTIAFHQNRLVFGGTPSAPNNIWMSKVGEYNNFDTGTGLDDEAIYTVLLSAQHNQICNLVSCDALQILTSTGEWAISNTPLTPSNVNIKKHTAIGSTVSRYLPPQQIEGSTVFVAQSGKDIRELDLDTLNNKYNATDLCVFSKHLLNQPTSIAYNPVKHKLFLIMEDGSMAVFHNYANTDIAAWGTYKTDGLFKYVAVVGNETYVIVKRNNTQYLEKFDNAKLQDADTYGFSYKVSSFPIIVNGHCPKKIRTRKISVRVMKTKTMFVNNYRMEIPDWAYAENNSGFTGDLSMNLLGTQCNTIEPLWTISSSEQLPATILSVSIEGWYLI